MRYPKVYPKHYPAMIGSTCIVRAKVEKSRWKSDATEYKPHWMMMLRLPGGHRERMSSLEEICPKCLAVPADQTPTDIRPNCACQTAARRVADEWHRTAATLWKERRLEDMRGLRLRREEVPLTLGELWDAFEAGLPTDMRETGMEYLAKCKIMVRERLGKDGDAARALPVTVLSLPFAREWINLRAAYNREGGKKSIDELRAAGAHLKAVNPNLALPGNATINSILGRAQALVGEKSRMHYLTALRVPLPPLGLSDARGLKVPKGLAWVPRGEHWEGMLKLVDEARQANERDFLIAFWLAATCGLRPIEILAVELSWFEVQDDSVFLLVRNLKDDGSADRRAFLQKAGENALSGRYPITGELADLVRTTAPGYIFHPNGKPTARENLLRRDYSKRIRTVVGDATNDTLYCLRKLYISTIARMEGEQAGSLAARHASGPQITRDHYIAPIVPVMAEITLEDLANR